MRTPFRILVLIAAVSLLLGGLFHLAGTAGAAQFQAGPPTSTPKYDRPGPVPTVYPPSQADNGAQVYWGMCQDCHGDLGQGLTADWRSAFAPEFRNCWTAGCHGEDPAENSFIILETGAPALAGPGALARFSTAFELGTYIHNNMPLFLTGSLTENQAWELTAYLLLLNKKGSQSLTLSGTNSAAVSVHHDLQLPEKELPGVLILCLVLFIASVGLSLGYKQKSGKGNFYHHLHPATIPSAQSRFGYTLGAGGLAVFFSLVLLITGALEMYYYLPTPEGAAQSIQMLTTLVPYGNLIRNLHYWSAQLLIITMMIHLVRILLTGAYAPPRRFNYLLGLLLLVLILLLDFTGYVLRWDEGIRWALVVGTNLLKTMPGIGEGLYRFIIGGTEPGGAALTRFYTWHIFGLTLLVAGITVWHIFRVRKDGGISCPPAERGEKTPRIPRADLVKKEVLAMFIAGLTLLLLSAVIPAPIGQPLTSNNALVGDSRAPWFFLWIQETLKLGNPFLWGVVLPLLAVLILGLLPYILPNAREEEWGHWLPKGNRIAQIVGIIIIAVLFLLTLLGWIK